MPGWNPNNVITETKSLEPREKNHRFELPRKSLHWQLSSGNCIQHTTLNIERLVDSRQWLSVFITDVNAFHPSYLLIQSVTFCQAAATQLVVVTSNGLGEIRGCTNRHKIHTDWVYQTTCCLLNFKVPTREFKHPSWDSISSTVKMSVSSWLHSSSVNLFSIISKRKDKVKTWNKFKQAIC